MCISTSLQDGWSVLFLSSKPQQFPNFWTSCLVTLLKDPQAFFSRVFCWLDVIASAATDTENRMINMRHITAINWCIVKDKSQIYYHSIHLLLSFHWLSCTIWHTFNCLQNNNLLMRSTVYMCFNGNNILLMHTYCDHVLILVIK